MADRTPSEQPQTEQAADEDIKAKMREALQRKHDSEHAGEAHLSGRAAARGVHGREGGQREFRRKAGG